MMPSRGMGAVLSSKMPKAKTGLRKDGDKFSDNGVTKRRKDGDKFTTYAKGGAVKKYQAGGKVDPRVLAAREAESALRSYNLELQFMDRSEIPPPDVQQAQKTQLYKQMIDAAPLGFVPDMLPGNSYGFDTPETWKGVEQLRKAGGTIEKPTQHKKGGKVKSKVNEAGNYTKPEMRKRIFNRIKAGSKGGNPGQWSARKAQMTAAAYKKAGGGYTS